MKKCEKINRHNVLIVETIHESSLRNNQNPIFSHFFTLLLIVFLLTACQSSWQAKVNLSPEQKQAIEEEIGRVRLEIDTYQPVPPDEINPPIGLYVDLGRAYENLGNYHLALKAYQEGNKLYKRSQALEHNIGRLYEKAGEWQQAIAKYQHLYQEYGEEPQYLYDIIWIYIRQKDLKNAEKYFNRWQQAAGKTDEQTQAAIKALRNK